MKRAASGSRPPTKAKACAGIGAGLRLSALWVLAATGFACASAALAGTPPALVNPAFEQRDPASGMPAGWTPLQGKYEIRSECAAACALRLKSVGEAGQVDGVYQQVVPGSAAGHVLTVSARIRTDDAEGNAFLAVSVLRGESMLADHANGPPPPNGTSGWRRIELVVPVPPDATGLVIGAVLRGKGSAWLDSLELRVDESVTAADYTARQRQGPPRPVPSQQLLDDAALRLAPSSIPTIEPAWRADVLARRHPVRSLFSDDFSDLQFLKPLLKDKRIVLLGEPAHGVAETSWAKVRLIKFLHRELGFDTVAFEGSVDQCHDADKAIGTLAPQEVMARCLFTIWQTHEVRGLFDYMAAVRKGPRPLALAGFDVQFSGAAVDKTRLPGMLARADSSLAARLGDHERELLAGKPLTAERAAELRAYYDEVAKTLAARRTDLAAAGHAAAEIDVAIRTAHARAWLARRNPYLDVAMSIPGNAVRDAGMAEQLDFLLDDAQHPQRKIIVWAHNMHVINAHAPGDFVGMGEVLAARRRSRMYTVGFYVGRGMLSNGHEAPWTVAPPPPETVEGVIANGGLRYAFVDFSQAAPGPATAWFNGENTVREFGTVAKKIVPARSYDGIFYIDTVTPAEKY